MALRSFAEGCTASLAWAWGALVSFLVTGDLHLLLQPLSQLLQRLATMRDLVLLDLWHLGVGLAFVFEASVPT